MPPRRTGHETGHFAGHFYMTGHFGGQKTGHFTGHGRGPPFRGGTHVRCPSVLSGFDVRSDLSGRAGREEAADD